MSGFKDDPVVVSTHDIYIIIIFSHTTKSNCIFIEMFIHVKLI